ncbi:ammonium transporter [Elysia marginata]|uniref:Ammonium transporter n=1 Tax=Elysia marginata TaxID=1093978 RepID=A0AAV4J1P0_9GAST|nr:ammonium transporter [Elysia marginata]
MYQRMVKRYGETMYQRMVKRYGETMYQRMVKRYGETMYHRMATGYGETMYHRMVAICAGCDVIRPWGSAIVGTIAGIAFNLTSWAMSKFGVDDPLDAVAGDENTSLNLALGAHGKAATSQMG